MKILLVPDRPGWAFDNRTKDLLALKWNGFRFFLKYQSDIKENDQHKYDLIYPLSLSIARKLNLMGIPYHKMATGITSIRIYEKQITGNGKFRPEFMQIIRKLRGINAWSDEIVRTFKPHCPIYKTRIGIDTELFKPGERRKSSGTFKVGWVGRIDKPEYRELKGYDIVLKAMEGLDAKLETRTFKENYVPRADMVEFYRGIDCFICSSRSEGLPNPLLEAAACGVPIITTKVGIVPELIRNRKNGIVVPRTPEAIRKQIDYLMCHPAERRALGMNARETIVNNWTWDICKREWEAFFKSVG